MTWQRSTKKRGLGSDKISYAKFYLVVRGVTTTPKRRDVYVEFKDIEPDSKLKICLSLDEATELYKKLHAICVPYGRADDPVHFAYGQSYPVGDLFDASK